MQDPRVAGINFGSFPSNVFTQRFQYFQIVNLVDCMSSWYKFVMDNPANIKFANFIVTPRIQRNASLSGIPISIYFARTVQRTKRDWGVRMLMSELWHDH